MYPNWGHLTTVLNTNTIINKINTEFKRHIKQSLQVLHIRLESSTDLMRFLKMSKDSDGLIKWLRFDQITGPKQLKLCLPNATLRNLSTTNSKFLR